MSTYKLYYFNTRGKAEICRLIFAQAGVQYEDIRFTGEEWQKFKPKTPYGFVPVLEVDGKMLAGTVPVARFLGEKFGLAGSNAIENAEIAGIIDFLEDLGLKMIQTFFEKDEAKKAELSKDLVEKHIPRYLEVVEKRIVTNNSGWLFGTKVTYADLYITRMIESLLLYDAKLLEKYPKIAKLNEDVATLPNIAKWIKERPV